MNSGDKAKPLYKPLLNKRLLTVSQPPERILFNQRIVKEHEAKRAHFISEGLARVEFFLDKDAYQPMETIRLRMVVDNSHSE